MAERTDPALRDHATRHALGSLELRLMNTLWASPNELSVQGVCDALGTHNNYKTVMTVLNRLVEKELLDRQLHGRAYRYRPTASRGEFLASVSQELVQGLVDSYGEEAAEHLVAAVASIAPQHGAPQPAQPGAAAQRAGRPSKTQGGTSGLAAFIFPWRRKR